MQRIARWSFAGLLLLCPSVVAASEIAAEALDRARTELREAVESGSVAGGVHMVGRNGRTVYLEVAGVRDLESGEPFTAGTIIRIYSMTRPVTSVTEMTLFEAEIGLDDPVSRYIPAFANTRIIDTPGEGVRLVLPLRRITVRDVLRHSTGYNYGGENAKAADDYQRERRRYRPPAGQLAVLDMAETIPFVEGFKFVSGGGGLVSTIRDYGNFCQMLDDGGEFKGRRVRKEETVRLMFTDLLQEAAGDFRFGSASPAVTLRSARSMPVGCPRSMPGAAMPVPGSGWFPKRGCTRSSCDSMFRIGMSWRTGCSGSFPPA